MESKLRMPIQPEEDLKKHPIIFFDGVCGLCNRAVDSILKADENRIFRFTPLQGETARELLPPVSETPESWSIIYMDEHGLHDQSDATLEICRRIGGFWSLLGLTRAVPRFIRHPIYRFIARNRYRWFGTKDICRIPTHQERAQFLP